MSIAAVILAGVMATFQQKEEPIVYRFEVQVSTVYADVFVKRGGAPVKGLTANDFEILDNGIPQQVEFLDVDALPLTTILVLDVSGSVEGEELEQLRGAAHAFVERLKDKDEVGLLTFTNKLQLPAELGRNFDALHRALEEPMASGNTSLYDAIYAASRLLNTRVGRPLVVLFTDGLDNRSWLTGQEMLDELKASEIVVHVVSYERLDRVTVRDAGRFTASPSRFKAGEFLESITTATGGRVWYIESGANLKDAFISVLTEMESRYLLVYQPRGVAVDGWHDLEIRVKDIKVDEIRARPGYFARPSQQ